MPQPRGPGGGDGPLERRGPGHVQRLRPPQAVGTALARTRRPGRGDKRALELAVPVDDHDEIAPGVADADVPGGAGEPPRVVQEPQWGRVRGQRRASSPVPIRRAAVHDEDLEAIGRIVLATSCPIVAPDEPGLVPDRDHHLDEREVAACRGLCRWVETPLRLGNATGNRERSWFDHVLAYGCSAQTPSPWVAILRGTLGRFVVIEVIRETMALEPPAPVNRPWYVNRRRAILIMERTRSSR